MRLIQSMGENWKLSIGVTLIICACVSLYGGSVAIQDYMDRKTNAWHTREAEMHVNYAELEEWCKSKNYYFYQVQSAFSYMGVCSATKIYFNIPNAEVRDEP